MKPIARWLRQAPLDAVRAEVARLGDPATRAKAKQAAMTFIGMTGASKVDPFVARLTLSLDDWLELLSRVSRVDLVWTLLKGMQ